MEIYTVQNIRHRLKILILTKMKTLHKAMDQKGQTFLEFILLFVVMISLS